ncbi:transcription factor HES-5-like [Lampris incognitus]|uniref:transcription factor HES-5-like n=1 Tax=Lampris incognitus TaxID=2546036 RepID=UPI0024B56E85|nr:transcription factor HES-5-like [Lampris incognitus]
MAPVTQNGANERPSSADNRRSNKLRKLMVEKVRRDRINYSIEQLRTLLRRVEQSDVQTSSSSSSCSSTKLEKADILEMAVRFLRERALMACSAAPNYSQGFSQCLQETLRHLSLHAPLRPAEREEIKRFYVLQRAALQQQLSAEKGRRTVATKPPPSRTTFRSHGSLWRPWLTDK